MTFSSLVSDLGKALRERRLSDSSALPSKEAIREMRSRLTNLTLQDVSDAAALSHELLKSQITTETATASNDGTTALPTFDYAWELLNLVAVVPGSGMYGKKNNSTIASNLQNILQTLWNIVEVSFEGSAEVYTPQSLIENSQETSKTGEQNITPCESILETWTKFCAISLQTFIAFLHTVSINKQQCTEVCHRIIAMVELPRGWEIPPLLAELLCFVIPHVPQQEARGKLLSFFSSRLIPLMDLSKSYFFNLHLLASTIHVLHLLKKDVFHLLPGRQDHPLARFLLKNAHPLPPTRGLTDALRKMLEKYYTLKPNPEFLFATAARVALSKLQLQEPLRVCFTTTLLHLDCAAHPEYTLPYCHIRSIRILKGRILVFKLLSVPGNLLACTGWDDSKISGLSSAASHPRRGEGAELSVEFDAPTFAYIKNSELRHWVQNEQQRLIEAMNTREQSVSHVAVDKSMQDHANRLTSSTVEGVPNRLTSRPSETKIPEVVNVSPLSIDTSPPDHDAPPAVITSLDVREALASSLESPIDAGIREAHEAVPQYPDEVTEIESRKNDINIVKRVRTPSPYHDLDAPCRNTRSAVRARLSQEHTAENLPDHTPAVLSRSSTKKSGRKMGQKGEPSPGLRVQRGSVEKEKIARENARNPTTPLKQGASFSKGERSARARRLEPQSREKTPLAHLPALSVLNYEIPSEEAVSPGKGESNKLQSEAHGESSSAVKEPHRSSATSAQIGPQNTAQTLDFQFLSQAESGTFSPPELSEYVQKIPNEENTTLRLLGSGVHAAHQLEGGEFDTLLSQVRQVLSQTVRKQREEGLQYLSLAMDTLQQALDETKQRNQTHRENYLRLVRKETEALRERERNLKDRLSQAVDKLNEHFSSLSSQMQTMGTHMNTMEEQFTNCVQESVDYESRVLIDIQTSVARKMQDIEKRLSATLTATNPLSVLSAYIARKMDTTVSR